MKVFLIVVVGLLLLVAAVLAYLVQKTSNAIDLIGVDNGSVVVPAGESVKEKPFAMVLTGVDTRPAGVPGGGINTDVMMVAAFNPTTKKATVVSIPRDTRVDVEGYKARKANRFYADFYTAAMKKGMEKSEAEREGMKGLREVLGSLFGVEIKYGAMVNFQGFRDVVDAVGGVEVNVDMRMKYSDSHDGTNIDLQKGVQKLDGSKALDFVRYRQSNDGKNMSSDFERNRRQGEVMGALVDKLMTFGGIMKIDSVIDAVSENLKMDMPKSEIKNMLSTYFNIKRDDITFIALEGNWKSPFVYLNETSLKEAQSALQAKLAE